jgi:ribosomal protein S6--L-glutamate ligase
MGRTPVKIGILGWDHGVMGAVGPFGEYDPEGPVLIEYGRRRGHEMSLFTLEEVTYVPGERGMDVLLGGENGGSFDAIISRAKLYGDDWQDGGSEWRDRVERLAMVSAIPGLHVFDPVDVWTTAYSKSLMLQKLAKAGLPVPPCRSATTLAEVATALELWDDIIVKPSYGGRSKGVERITDISAQQAVIEELLAGYGTMLCMPFYPTRYGEYRVHVAGDVVAGCALKLPGPGEWKMRGSTGSSFEPIDPSDELRDLALRATRTIGLTLSGLDILPTETGYVILEVNCTPGFLNSLGDEIHRITMDAIYDWVEKRVAEG